MDEGFIISDELRFEISEDLVEWEGTLNCADGIKVRVTKHQDVRTKNGRLYVRTTFYQYHVFQHTSTGSTEWFRYDNTHARPGHPTEHHRHCFDDNGVEIAVKHMGVEGWPTLGDVLDEAHTRWLQSK